LKKMTIGELIKVLQKFSKDATWHAYEGEITGLVVTDEDGSEIGWVNDGSAHPAGWQWSSRGAEQRWGVGDD